MRIFRVVVRGQFADLTETQRTSLAAEAEQHHFLRSAFTAAGTLTYDEQLVAFNFRYEVRHDDEAPADDAIGAAAIARSVAALADMDLTAKHLRATVTDMATIWN